MAEANKKVQESAKEREAVVSQMYSNEIALLKAQGKDTYDTEVEASKSKSTFAKQRYDSAKKAFDAEMALGKEADQAKIKELKKQIADERAIIGNERNNRKILAITEAKEDQAKIEADNKKAIEKQKEYSKNRLDARRNIRDLEIALITDEAKREEATTKEKYARLRADLLTNDKLTKDERKKLKDLYDKQELADLELANKKILDAELANAKRIADGIKAYKEVEAQNQEDIEEINYQAGLTAREKERQDLQYHYDELIAQAQRYGVDSTNIEAEFALKKAELDKKNLEEDNKLKQASIDKSKAERDAKIAFANDIANGITAVGGMLIKDQKKLEQFNKASALVQIGIDTAKAISSLVAMSQANPLNAVTAGGAGIAQYASGIVQIITNVAKAKALLSNPTGSPSGGVSGGSTESSTSVSPATPAIQMFGQGNDLNSQGQLKSSSASQNMVVTAVVSESDITSTQSKLFKLQKNAEL